MIAQIPNLRELAGFGTLLNDQVMYKTIRIEAITNALIAFSVVSRPIVGPIVSNSSSLTLSG